MLAVMPAGEPPTVTLRPTAPVNGAVRVIVMVVCHRSRANGRAQGGGVGDQNKGARAWGGHDQRQGRRGRSYVVAGGVDRDSLVPGRDCRVNRHGEGARGRTSGDDARTEGEGDAGRRAALGKRHGTGKCPAPGDRKRRVTGSARRGIDRRRGDGDGQGSRIRGTLGTASRHRQDPRGDREGGDKQGAVVTDGDSWHMAGPRCDKTRVGSAGVVGSPEGSPRLNTTPHREAHKQSTSHVPELTKRCAPSRTIKTFW